jgi:hypothetical protein
MKTILNIVIISFLIVVASCEEEKKNPVLPASFPCIEYLDSNTFDLSLVISSRVNVSTNQASGKEERVVIDSNHPDFVSHQFSNDGTKVTKFAKGITYPERSFKIENNYFYYGDDASLITACSQNSYTILSHGSDYNSQDNTVDGYWATFNKR